MLCIIIIIISAHIFFIFRENNTERCVSAELNLHE